MYNTTNITSAANYLDLTIAINQLSEGFLAGMIMLSLFIIIFIMFSQYDKKIVLLADSALLSLIGIFLFVLNMIGWTILIIPLVALFISLMTFKIFD